MPALFDIGSDLESLVTQLSAGTTSPKVSRPPLWPTRAEDPAILDRTANIHARFGR